MAQALPPSFWGRLEQRMFGSFFGVEGGVLLRGAYWRQLGQKYPRFAKVNNALWAAPAFKWGLAIIPLYGAITGKPPVEDLDLNQSLALTFTGVVWAYYATLVTPRANLLLAVNLALFFANGNNVIRKFRYDSQHKKQKENGEIV